MTEGAAERKSLAGKVALITGGCGGLGQATAARLRSSGADVIISDLDADQGAEVAMALGVTFLQQDVSNPDDWAQIAASLEARFDGLDIW